MKPSLRYLPLLALAVATIPVASSVDLDTARSQPPATTLHLNLPRSEPDAIADRGKKGPSTGDELYITDTITDEARKPAGSVVAHASLFTKNLNHAQMLATISLKRRGSLTLHGKLNLAARRNQGTLAIVGGTGEFTGAGGSAKVTTNRSETISFKLALAP